MIQQDAVAEPRCRVQVNGQYLQKTARYVVSW
jgi:hypothetical protein